MLPGQQKVPNLDSGAVDPADVSALLDDLFAAAVGAVSAAACMPAQLPGTTNGHLHVIAVGKAAAAMMQAVHDRVPVGSGLRLTGLVVTRHGHLPPGAAWHGVEVIVAGHPVPDDASLAAAQKALDIAGCLGPKDHLLVLLSGGGSALMAAPVQGVALVEKQALTRALLRSGASISEINCVRRHLSRIKAGRLAAAASPARITTWIISDVPGDDAALVASGPTLADATTLAMARDILARYAIAPAESIITALADPANETPPPEARARAGDTTTIIACARNALAAAAALAASRGYDVLDLGDAIEAPARSLAAQHAALALRQAADAQRCAIISGGEASVVVNNPLGRGGRNLEYLLALAIALDGAAGIHAIACDTDGIDGTENAAGARVHPDTLARARAAGLDPHEHLAGNNAYCFFEALGDLVVTGPTLTNVNDFRAILVCERDASPAFAASAGSGATTDPALPEPAMAVPDQPRERSLAPCPPGIACG